ncbi:MAG: MucBP domain-containing protein [Clostridia bacterium]|nr:MucBP domain-containing protein [Clostridia bacterium]
MYIINAESHNIFYVEGIVVDDTIYFTNYSEPDKEKVPLKVEDTTGTHKLKINYKKLDGEQIDVSREGKYRYGEFYYVKSPEIEGYKILEGKEIVSGEMKSDDIEINVFYEEEI